MSKIEKNEMNKEIEERLAKYIERKRREELGEKWESDSSYQSPRSDDLIEIDEDNVVARYSKFKVDGMKVLKYDLDHQIHKGCDHGHGHGQDDTIAAKLLK